MFIHQLKVLFIFLSPGGRELRYPAVRSYTYPLNVICCIPNFIWTRLQIKHGYGTSVDVSCSHDQISATVSFCYWYMTLICRWGWPWVSGFHVCLQETQAVPRTIGSLECLRVFPHISCIVPSPSPPVIFTSMANVRGYNHLTVYCSQFLAFHHKLIAIFILVADGDITLQTSHLQTVSGGLRSSLGIYHL